MAPGTAGRDAGGMTTRLSELSGPARAATAATGLLQVAMLVAAQVDIARRRDAQLNGPRRAWQAVTLINVVGPLAYWRWGRAGPR